MKIGLVANKDLSLALKVAKEVYNYLLESNQEIMVEESLSKIFKTNGVKIEDMDVDIIITVGGDGTVLHTLMKTNKPIFSINAGRLGFLTEILPVDLEYYLNKLINKEYFIEDRRKLKVLLNDERLPDCTNEVVIHTNEISKMRSYAIYIDNELMDEARADGIIVSTATGSTSYSLSVGGPIVDPRISSMIISFIAPFKLAARPHVVPGKSKIEIHMLDKKKKSLIVLDGQVRKNIIPSDIVQITESENTAKFVKFSNKFYEKLREKML
ncbi:MAG: NAD(+)/NADH kinase [Thermoplasmata archaeon]|jgi:NAD+ kinase